MKTTLKKSIYFFLFLVMSLSCNKEKADTIEQDLTWLEDIKSSMISCTCQMSIYKATYKKQTVYYVAMTDPLCDGAYRIELRNTKGEIIKTFTSENPADFTTEITQRKAIYVCN